MKHHKAGRTLGRKKGQRTALLRSLTRSLVMHEKITTTVARAKELRPFVEELVTRSKKTDIASRRFVSMRLGGSPETVKKLHETVATPHASPPGGPNPLLQIPPP